MGDIVGTKVFAKNPGSAILMYVEGVENVVGNLTTEVKLHACLQLVGVVLSVLVALAKGECVVDLETIVIIGAEIFKLINNILSRLPTVAAKVEIVAVAGPAVDIV